MEYIQLPFKFIIFNLNKIRQNLDLSLFDYSYFIRDFNKIEPPTPKPSYAIENYIEEEEKWKFECIKNTEFRKKLREVLITELEYINFEISDSKLNPRRVSFITQNIYEYKFYHKNIVDNWIEIWERRNIEFESLETLLLFKKILLRHCLNNEAVEQDNLERNEMWIEDAKDAAAERKYWNDNYYEEGGGGQDWSDPFH